MGARGRLRGPSDWEQRMVGMEGLNLKVEEDGEGDEEEEEGDEDDEVENLMYGIEDDATDIFFFFFIFFPLSCVFYVCLSTFYQ